MAASSRRYARDLRDAGVRRINVSLDTLDPGQVPRDHPLGRSRQGAGRHRRGAERRASRSRSTPWRCKGVNEDEIPDLMRWAHGQGFDFTLIETMPMGEIDDDRVDAISAAVAGARTSLAREFTLDDTDYRTGGPARYVRRRGDRRHGSASSRRSPTISAKAAIACG